MFVAAALLGGESVDLAKIAGDGVGRPGGLGSVCGLLVASANWLSELAGGFFCAIVGCHSFIPSLCNMTSVVSCDCYLGELVNMLCGFCRVGKCVFCVAYE